MLGSWCRGHTCEQFLQDCDGVREVGKGEKGLRPAALAGRRIPERDTQELASKPDLGYA